MNPTEYNVESISQIWENIELSEEILSPELFTSFGLAGYNNYIPHEGIPNIWIHKTFQPALCADKICLFMAAPSNTGKDAVITHLQDLCPNLIRPIITATDRPPRYDSEGNQIEFNGIHQYFYTPEQFQDMIQKKLFIEYSQTRPPYWFGIPKSEMKRSTMAQFTVLRITVGGIQNVKPLIEKDYFPTIRIGILPALTLSQYKQMLFMSGKENAQDRYQTALKEMQHIALDDNGFEILLMNPWDPTGRPNSATTSLHALLHAIHGQYHIL